ANVGDEDGHLHHVAQLAAGLLKRAIEVLKNLPDLAVKVAGERFAGVIDDRNLPGEPHRPAAFCDDSRGIAALLRSVALEKIPRLSRRSMNQETGQGGSAEYGSQQLHSVHRLLL